MGTLSKRKLEDFGADIRDRVQDFTSNVGDKLDDVAGRVSMQSQMEGHVTRAIERITSALPSSTWLALAGGSIVSSLALHLFDRKHAALFVGQWAPTFLMLGLYNKLVKIAGSDRVSGSL